MNNEKSTRNKLVDLFMNRRGYTPEYLQKINNPNHPKLENNDKLCKILHKIRLHHDRIVIMPDFDTDGISAGLVGFTGLSELGFNVALYMAHPEWGYGINVRDIKAVQKEYPDTKYIITCDVGITCYEAFKYAYEHGLKVLITDHHEEQKVKKLSNDSTVFKDGTPVRLFCETIVNPCQLSETYPLRNICGAHVFYQVLLNYALHYSNQDEQNKIYALLVFAGIGTIGDMMSMFNENRALIKETINMLKYLYNCNNLSDVLPRDANPLYKRAFIGLKILLLDLHQNGKLKDANTIDEKWMGWTLSPVFNTAKRLYIPMTTVYGIFYSKTAELQSKNAEALISANLRRKKLTVKYTQEIRNGVKIGSQPWAPLIYISKASGGFLGLIANNLMKETGLPTFVLNNITLTGSGRSPEWFPVITALQNTDFYVAGHEGAFGIKLYTIKQTNKFYNYLSRVLPPLIRQEQARGPRVDYDLLLSSYGYKGKSDEAVNLDDDWGFYNYVQRLKPFGEDFAEPKIRINFNPQTAHLQLMSEGKHAKVVLPEGLQLISWNHGPIINKIADKEISGFEGNLDVNVFRGHKSLQLIGDFDTDKK